MSFSITQIKYPLQYFNRPVNASIRMGALFLSLLFASLALCCVGLFIMGVSQPLPDSMYYFVASITMLIAFSWISRLFYNFTFAGTTFNPGFRQMTKEYRVGFFDFPK